MRGSDGNAFDVAPAHRLFLDSTLPHLGAVRRAALSFTRDAGRVEDLVQETYLRAFAAFHTHDGRSTGSWLVAICLNAARSDGRRRRVRAGELLTAVLPERSDHLDDVADCCMHGYDRKDLARALAQLSPEQRAAVVMMDVAGLTAQEVADSLHCPRGTILARAHRGRRKLAAILEANRLPT